MSWRTVIISKRSKLDLKLGYLVVRSDEAINRIHLNEIAVLIIENTAISITGCLISELASNKIKVIFCDNKRNPCSELINYFGSHDCSLKISKQTKWDEVTKQIIWREIVGEKIKQQSKFLKDLDEMEAHYLLEEYLSQIEVGDISNREGHAAKVYFNAVFGKEFTRSKDNSINAGLNFGYSLILSAFNREIVANGYLTQLGIFHNNMFNYFNLSSDLMEPFRIIVDRIVKKHDFKIFEKEQKKLLLDIFNQSIIIDGKEQLVSNAIKIYCKSFFDAMEKNNIALLKFYGYEL